MSEQLPQKPPYEQRLFDYFLSRPQDAERRAAYISRGLIPTNNLSLYIVDDPNAEIIPGSGVSNPWNWRQKSFGHLIEALKTDQPELWERAKEVTATSGALIKKYWEVASTNGLENSEVVALQLQCNTAQWEHATVYTRIIEILGPQLDAEGIDPIELCG